MRRTWAWRVLPAVLAVAVALGGAACSDDEDEPAVDGSPSTTTTASPADVTGPCPYVSTETVAEAFGLPVELADGSEHSCDFIVGDAATLLINAEHLGYTCDPGTEVEVERAGSACLADGVPSATVAENEYVVGLKVTGEVAAEASRDALVRLLPQVTPGG